jgi:glycosyltransferase involved in cell wall biosynthesis
LIVSHPPLRRELGGAQTGVDLAAALAARGHEVITFSPEPLPAETPWWNRFLAQRRAIEAMLARQAPFDAIDLPPVSVSPAVARAARVVARSIQPDRAYLAIDLEAELARRPWPPLGLPLRALYAWRVLRAIERGWRRADHILCLGSLEREELLRRHPTWSAKVGLYRCGLAEAERAALAPIRAARGVPSGGIRWLWIGRWAAHKGTTTLQRFLAEWLPARPQDRVTIAGCGEAPLRELPAALLASGQVTVLPRFERAELPALLARHDAGLFTSLAEGWGLSLNEMLESGLTVYATRAGAVADLAPWFPHQLRPFPPPAELTASDLATPEVSAEYERTFSWAQIARGWEEAVLATPPRSGSRG